MKKLMKTIGKIIAIALITCVAVVALLRVDRQCSMMYGTENSMSETVTGLVYVFRFEIEKLCS